MRYAPSMHPDFPMETRVQVDKSIYPGDITGTIVGVASMHIIFVYIVLLDSPIWIEHDQETYRAIAVPGCQLKPIA